MHPTYCHAAGRPWWHTARHGCTLFRTLFTHAVLLPVVYMWRAWGEVTSVKVRPHAQSCIEGGTQNLLIPGFIHQSARGQATTAACWGRAPPTPTYATSTQLPTYLLGDHRGLRPEGVWFVAATHNRTSTQPPHHRTKCHFFFCKRAGRTPSRSTHTHTRCAHPGWGPHLAGPATRRIWVISATNAACQQPPQPHVYPASRP